MIEMDAWTVAAALLIKLGSSLHHSDLTRRVKQTRLSGLGYKGGQTPEATLRAIMGEKSIGGKRVFCRVARGTYTVNCAEQLKEVPEIKAALEALRGFDPWGNRIEAEDTIESLRQKLQERDQRIEILESTIRDLIAKRIRSKPRSAAPPG